VRYAVSAEMRKCRSDLSNADGPVSIPVPTFRLGDVKV
jgi:hypothetical protein